MPVEKHSPEALAAYPDYNPTSTMAYVYPGGPVAERAAFDRGMAHRRTIEREALARIVRKIGLDSQVEPMSVDQIADAILVALEARA